MSTVLPAASALARIGAGFADPTHGAQQTFRTLLAAMSLPGRLHALPAAATAGLEATQDERQADMAPPVGIGMAATLLTLLDADTPVLLAGAMGSERAQAWIRFHTGARPLATGEAATLAAARAGELTPELWQRLALGSDEAPQDGATLIVDVEALSDCPEAADGGVALTLRGPGIEEAQALVVQGLPGAFWRWREGLAVAMPRGVDLVLIHGSTLAAIPRSSRIERRA